MKRISTTPTVLPSTNMGAVGKAWDEVSASFDRFCLAAGVDALGAMLEKDAEEACGARHARSEERRDTVGAEPKASLDFMPAR
jgi:putative transposase